MAIKFLSGLNLSNVTAGSILKLDSNGNIVAAVDGTDYNTASSIWTGANGGIYYSNNVRIGTYQTSVAPSAKLHVFDYQTTTPKLLIEDGNTGDASMQFKISTQSYTMGIDNSDSDKFILAASSALGTTNVLEVSTTGLSAFQTGVLFNADTYHLGNVGIGTTSPGALLHVNSENSQGTLIISRGGNNLAATNNVGSITFPADYNGTPTNYAQIKAYANALSAVRGSLDFNVKSTSGTLLTGMTVYGTSSGVNVGIGSTAPAAKLNVASTGANAYSSTVTKGTNMKGIINVLSSNADDMVGIYFGTGVTSEGTHWSGITGSRSQNAVDWSTQLNFYTHDENISNLNDATQKMVIKGSGNVGIGTTSPASKLDVAGSISVTSGDTFGYDSYHGSIYMATGGRGLLGKFGGSGYARNLIKSDGSATIHIGDNTSLISRILLDAGSAGTNGYISLQTKQVERVRITHDGNVGIGVIPKTGGNTWQHIQFGGTGNIIGRISDSTVDAMFANNYYINSSNVDSHIITGAATRMFLNDGEIRFDTAPSAAADAAATFTNRLFIANTGNVGIGTTSPEHKLHVAGRTQMDYLKVGGDTSSSSTYIYDGFVDANSAYFHQPTALIRTDSSASGGIDEAPVALALFNRNGANNTWVKMSLASREVAGGGNTVSLAGIAAQKISGTSGSWASGKLHLWTKNGADFVENMTLRPNGNVGVGIDNPGYKLDVDGTIRSGTGYRTSINGDGSGAVVLFGSAADIDALGVIGAYASKFNISSGNGDMSFQFNNTERMLLASNGNLKLNAYTAGILKTDANGNVSLDTNTYLTSLPSHNHDDRYYTETESDQRFPRGRTIGYSSVDTASESDAWYKIFTTTDSDSTPVECHVRGYAHTSMSFIVSEGYLGSGGHVQVLDYCLSTNNNYKWIKGVRIISNGDVELLLNGGSTVSLEMTIIGDATVFTQPRLSSAAANTVKDTVVNPTTGMLRAKGNITGANLSGTNTGDQDLSGYAPLASPGLTGTPTAPTAGSTTNTTQIATTAFVQTAVSSLVDSAPSTLDTLNELAAALGDDASFSTTVTNSIATKLPLAGGTLTSTGTSSSPVLEFVNSSSGTFNHTINAFAPNLTSGENNIFIIGRAGSTKNSGYIGYRYSSAGSNDNVLTFGHWGSDNLMNLTGDGKLGIGTTSPGAKLDVVGNIASTGQISVNNRTAISVGHWSASGNTTGAVKITIPGSHSSNWSMIVLRITAYEYNSTNHTIYYVSGHDWTSGWYNNGVTKMGDSNKDIKLGWDSNKDYVILGGVSDTWSYGHVTVDVMAHPSFYNGNMDITSGWDVRLTADLNGITTQTVTNRKVLTTADEGSGNGIDADKVDGLQASSFLRSDANDTGSGRLTLTYNDPADPLTPLEIRGGGNHTGLYINPHTNKQGHIRFAANGALKWQMRVPFQDGVNAPLKIYSWVDGADRYTFNHNGDFYAAGDIYANSNKVATETFVTTNYKTSDDTETYVAQELTGYTPTSSFGTAAFTASTDYATSTQGTTADNALARSGGTMSGTLTTTSNNNGGIYIGSGGANFTSVAPSSKDVILQDVSEFRFGGASWDWNAWAGIKFDDSNEILYIGGPAASQFSSNSNPPIIDVNFVGVDEVQLNGNALATETFAAGEAEGVQDNLDSLAGSLGSLAYSSATIPTNNNQLTNGAGYITAVPSTFDATSIGIGSKVTISESTDRADLLYINSHTSGWGGLQIGNTSNEFIFSLMGNGNAGGIYDDQNGDWIIYWDENAGVQLNHNSNNKLLTVSDGVNITGRLYASSGIEVPYGIGEHRPMVVLNGATNYGLFHTEATNDEFTFDFNGTQKFKFSQDGILTVNGNTVTTGKITNWDTAYGWGDHSGLYDAAGTGADEASAVQDNLDGLASSLGTLAYSSATIPTNNNQLTNGAGYITGYTETDTLASVTGRGASTTTALSIRGLTSRTIVPETTVAYDLGTPEARWQIVFCQTLDSAGQHESQLQNPEGEKSVGDYATGTVLVWKGGKNIPCTEAADHMRMGIAVNGIDSPLVQGAEPVLVTGSVNEGDYLVTSSVEGHAKAITPQFMRQHMLFDCVIGKALESGEGDSHLIKTWINI